MALTVAQRAAKYYAQRYGPSGPPPGWQENPPKLTPAQRRRIKHKRGHAIQSVVRARLRLVQRRS
jgi:hypothetical protein